MLIIILCSSCAGPRAYHGRQAAAKAPIGGSRCGPAITYQVFQPDAFGAEWSMANDLIAFNAKGSLWCQLKVAST